MDEWSALNTTRTSRILVRMNEVLWIQQEHQEHSKVEWSALNTTRTSRTLIRMNGVLWIQQEHQEHG